MMAYGGTSSRAAEICSYFMMFYDVLCSAVLFLCVFMIRRYFNGFADILFHIVYFIFCCVVVFFHGEATVMLYPTVIPVVIRMQRVGVLKNFKIFQSGVSTKYRTEHAPQSLFWALTSLGWGNFFYNQFCRQPLFGGF